MPLVGREKGSLVRLADATDGNAIHEWGSGYGLSGFESPINITSSH